ncbi:MAG: HipA N-terminal domain-containing protein [Bacteroidetes bacterium]|nr:HipA N-terminal domain-containing protein [Bacteroidota bacterium]
MRKAKVLVNGIAAGILRETEPEAKYVFEYLDGYKGLEISRTIPTNQQVYNFNHFPPFFDGLLPEGFQLEGLLKIRKIDRNDYFSQLLAVGEDLVGVITVKEIPE